MEITAIAFVALVAILILTGVRVVPQGYNYTVERLGRFTRVLHPV